MRDRDSNKRLEQEISMRRVFYKSTGAVPAWWLAPDWKRVALLRDVLWGELKKNKLKKEALLQGFDELLAQCDRE